MNRLALFSLTFWMNGAESTKLGKAAHAWFSMLGKAAAWSLNNRDPMTCDERTLSLLAWERCVRRYPGEPERLYRLRVTHAYANARDSGQTAGWGRIFERLELGGLSLAERVPGQDWDRVGIIAEATENGDGKIYTITNDTANAAGMRQGRFTGNFKVDEDEKLRMWSISFTLAEHVSVPEMEEARQGARAASTQTNTGASVGSDEEEKEEELSSIEKVLKYLNEKIGPENEE